METVKLELERKTRVAFFKKKPVVIEAFQFNEPDVFFERWLERSFGGWGSGGFWITTLEGALHASPGDWIIKGVKGEFYPCKPDIFEMTYEPSSE